MDRLRRESHRRRASCRRRRCRPAQELELNEGVATVPLTVFAGDRVVAQQTYEPPKAPSAGAPGCGDTAAEQQPAAEPAKDFGRRDGETTQEYLKREVRRPAAAAARAGGTQAGAGRCRRARVPPPSPPPQFSALKPFVIISLSYLLFTTTDGAIRMIVLLHAYNSGFSAWQVAIMFSLYELAGAAPRLGGLCLACACACTCAAPIGRARAVVVPQLRSGAGGALLPLLLLTPTPRSAAACPPCQAS
jgi:hypothetical protein